MQTPVNANQVLLSALSKNSEKDINELVFKDVVYIVLIYFHLWLAVEDFVPLWTFCIAAPMYVSRWMLGLHETFHLVNLQNTNLFIRLHMLITTPFSIGYKEQRDIHMRHHAYTLKDKDPDFYLVSGNFFTAFLKATLSPEIATYKWVRDNGMDKQLMLGMTFRFIIFLLFIWYLGWTSLWYFIPVRLAYAGSMFSITFLLHRKEGRYGTFTPYFGRFLEFIMQLYFGRAALNTLKYHDIHHDYPRIAERKLPEARDVYKPKPSSLANVA